MKPLSLGQKLKVSRKRLKITQQQLATRAHLDVGMISHYETDRREPTLNNLVKLNKVLRRDFNWLLEQ
jgi:transcriptional regulator with XRE-family HTH domain